MTIGSGYLLFCHRSNNVFLSFGKGPRFIVLSGVSVDIAHWHIFSVAALLLLGTQRFLYKVAAEKQCHSALTTSIFMATVTLLSGMTLVVTEADFPPQNPVSLVALSLLNSTAFALTTIAHIEALRYLPAGMTFPLTRLSLVVVVFFSVIYFDEQLGPLAWCGILLSFIVIFMLARDPGRVAGVRNFRRGLWFILICVLSGAVAAISSKLAAQTVNISAFMALSYLFGTLFSLGIEKAGRHTATGTQGKKAVILGLFMGLLNFFGFYAFLQALTTGPLAAIALITGMHFVIAIILAALIYREPLTRRRILAIGLTFLAVFLLRL